MGKRVLGIRSMRWFRLVDAHSLGRGLRWTWLLNESTVYARNNFVVMLRERVIFHGTIVPEVSELTSPFEG